jgi:predicted metal-binding protein
VVRPGSFAPCPSAEDKFEYFAQIMAFLFCGICISIV